MIVPKEIVKIEGFSLLCKFNNGELRELDVKKVLAHKEDDEYVNRILTPTVFPSVKIGEIGQLLWENVARMQDYDGKWIPCEYDMSPEFVYHNSTVVRS